MSSTHEATQQTLIEPLSEEITAIQRCYEEDVVLMADVQWCLRSLMQPQQSEVAAQFRLIAAEDRAVENVTGNLENPPSKHVPACWAFTQMSKQDEETFGEVVGERVPSPQNTTEQQIVYDLERSSVRIEQCRTGITTEYQSEGEEDDLFLDTAEPSVLPKPTDACELGQVCVNNRQWMLTLLQRVVCESEVTQTQQIEYEVGSSTLEEVPKLFGLAAKALPTPTRAMLQDAVSALQTVEEISERSPSSEVTALLSACR